MQRPFTVDFGRPVWRCLLVVVAILAALQSLSAGLQAARGPLHAHRPDRAAEVSALVDFRRALTPGSARMPSHDHGHGGAARHHHDSADDSVLALDDETARAASAVATDDAGAAQPAFLPLPSNAPRLPEAGTTDIGGRRSVDRWRSRSTAPPERPPRVG